MTHAALELRLKAFRLPTFLASYVEVAERARKAGWSHIRYLEELANLEAEERHGRRIERLLKTAKLPRGKTFATLNVKRFPSAVQAQITALEKGEFLEGAMNVCIFGRPGTGKSHLMAAVGHALVRHGKSVLFVTVKEIVERLLAAKRDLALARELRKLDNFDCLALDDIGYVQQDRSEMEVLFTLLAERYERRSVLLTSNLVFSKWDQIFKDPMTTAAAIDRVVHHSIIVELNVRSYRADEAERRGNATEEPSVEKGDVTEEETSSEEASDEEKEPGEDESSSP